MNIPNLEGLSKEEITEIIELGIDMKNNPEKYNQALKGKILGMWFEKPSLRTSVSFQSGITQLGGQAIFIDSKKTHAKKAGLKDEVKCLAGYVDLICARVFSQDTINAMCESSSVPVINALSDTYHPCQALADMMTVFETKKDAVVSYVGDGNNVCNSLILICKKLGIKIVVSTPKDLKPIIEPDAWYEDPKDIVADFMYTDTWVSMGNEDAQEEYISKLKPYQVNKELIGDKYFLHCLPAIRGQEVTDEVIDSEKSLVFQQAENRMHAQKALMMKVLGV